MTNLTRAQKLDAQAIFRGDIPGKGPCEDCGGLHQRACPRIKRQVWIRTGPGDGKRSEVEYWPPGWDDTGVIWPEDAFDEDDSSEEQGG